MTIAEGMWSLFRKEPIDQYLTLLKEATVPMGFHDPIDQSIGMVFDLVIERRLDPWDIDLVQFSSLYLDRVQKEGIDLGVAGRLVLMAWKVLRLQSDDVLAGEVEATQEEIDWGDLPAGEWYADDASYDFTTQLLQGSMVPLHETGRRRAQRRVTILELMDALKRAREEITRKEAMRRRRLKRSASRTEGLGIRAKIHQDEGEEAIGRIWRRLRREWKNTKEIAFSILKGRGKEDLVQAMGSILSLTKDQKVHIRQVNFPYGEIYVARADGEG